MFPVIFFRLGRIIGLLAFVLALAPALQGCSTVKVAYNQAPTLAYLYLGGYADFSDTQTPQIKAELGKFHAWHRQTQLPAYIDLLQKLQQKMPQDVTVGEACEVFADVRQKALTMADYAQTGAASVAATLTQQQLDAIQRKFAKGNAAWREDYMTGTASDIFEKRQKSALKRSDMLYGSVNDKQRGLIDQQIEKSRFSPAQSYAERQRRQKDMLQTLGKVMASPQDTAAAQQEMRSLLARAFTPPDAAYRSYLQTVTQDGCAGFAEQHNAATPEQRKKAVQVLAGYEQDFKVLLGQK